MKRTIMDSFLISIAGNITAGKSTFTKALEKRSRSKTNAMLPEFSRY